MFNTGELSHPPFKDSVLLSPHGSFCCSVENSFKFNAFKNINKLLAYSNSIILLILHYLINIKVNPSIINFVIKFEPCAMTTSSKSSLKCSANESPPKGSFWLLGKGSTANMGDLLHNSNN